MEPESFSSMPGQQFEFYALNKFKNSTDYGNNLTVNGEEKYQLSKIINEDDQGTTTIVHGFPLPEPDELSYKPSNIDYSSDTPEFYSSSFDTSSKFILSNVSAKEDFTVNSAQQPDYAPKLPHSKTSTAKQKLLETHDKRRSSPVGHVRPATNLRKTSSSSTVDLRKIDEQFSSISTSSRKPISRGSSPIRNSANSKIRKSESTYQVKNQNQKNQNLNVQFYTKPQRSKTTLDIKSNIRSSIPRSVQSPQPAPVPVPQYYQPSIPQPISIPHHLIPQPISMSQYQMPMTHPMTHSHEPASFNSFETSNEAYELQSILTGHDTVFNTMCNRITSLDMIRNQMR